MLYVLFLHSVTLFTLGGRDTQVSGLASLLILAVFGYTMPFFFIMSGYNYKPGALSYGATILKRARQLLIPLVNYSIVIWVILGAYLCLRGETSPLPLLKSYVAFWITDPLAGWLGLDASRTLVAQAIGPTWFIKCLMMSYLIFAAVAPFALKKNTSAFSVVMGLFIASYIIAHFVDDLPWDAEAAPAGAGLMLIGTLMRKHRLLESHPTRGIWIVINTIVALAILFQLQRIAPGAGMFSGGRLVYKTGPIEVFITLAFGIIGTVFLMNISRWLARFKHPGTFLAYFGQNSLVALIIHGAIMRIYCDIFGVTGSPAGKFGLANLIVFILTAATTTLFIYLKGRMNIRMQNRRAIKNAGTSPA
ncbi:MAG: acyltransferase [Bacteroidales bacterium]|nr:acyltransferase [Bacteroidales bacterium]